MSRRPEFGETWTYESIIGALPGLDLPQPAAIAIQFVLFEAALLALAWYYGLWNAAVGGTVAVAVAAVGSAEMLHIGKLARRAEAPPAYSRLLFGSSVEVVLAVLAFVALVTHLFVFDARAAGESLVASLFGPTPPVLAVYLMLLVLWDVCYRIGTGWWASVVALWRSVRYEFDPATRRTLARADAETMAFGLVQLVFVPFLTDQPVLLAALVGHVVAVTAVTGLSMVALRIEGGVVVSGST